VTGAGRRIPLDVRNALPSAVADHQLVEIARALRRPMSRINAMRNNNNGGSGEKLARPDSR